MWDPILIFKIPLPLNIAPFILRIVIIPRNIISMIRQEIIEQSHTEEITHI